MAMAVAVVTVSSDKPVAVPRRACAARVTKFWIRSSRHSGRAARRAIVAESAKLRLAMQLRKAWLFVLPERERLIARALEHGWSAVQYGESCLRQRNEVAQPGISP